MNLVGCEVALLGEQFLMCLKKPIALILNSPVRNAPGTLFC